MQFHGDPSLSGAVPGALTTASPASAGTAAEPAPARGASLVDVAGSSTRATSSQREWLSALRYCALVYAGVRVGLFVVGLVSTALLPRSDPANVPTWPATDPGESWHHVFTAWERFDALWFLSIAANGYRVDDGSAAFFPGYPLLTRAVGEILGGQWLLAAYVVSNLSLVVALVLLYRLTTLEFDETTARRAVLYLCIFPTGFFLFAPYSEALFLALSLGCLYAARRQSWLLAGYLGALATLTRSTGLLLAVALAVEALLQFRASGGPVRARLLRLTARLAATSGPLIGMGAYFLYWSRLDGNWRRPLDVQAANWGKERAWPWETLWAGAKEGTRYFGSYSGGYHTVDLIIVAVALVSGIWILFRVRLSYALYFWASLLFPMTLAWGGRPFMSMPRYLLVVFPLFWAFAALAQRWKAHDAVVAASAAGMGLLAVLFVNWYPLF